MTYITIKGSTDIEKKESLAQAILLKAKEYGEISASRLLQRYTFAKELGAIGVMQIFNELEEKGYGKAESKVASNGRKTIVFTLASTHYWRLYRPFNKIIKGNKPDYESQNKDWELVEDMATGYLVASQTKELASLIPGWIKRGWRFEYLGIYK